MQSTYPEARYGRPGYGKAFCSKEHISIKPHIRWVVGNGQLCPRGLMDIWEIKYLPSSTAEKYENFGVMQIGTMRLYMVNN